MIANPRVYVSLACFGLFVLSAQQAAPPAVYTEAQAADGKAAYLSACAKCHGENLAGHDGTGEIPEFLQSYGGLIPPLAGKNAAYPPFLTTWGPQTTAALSSRIKVAVGGFPPPNRRVIDELYFALTAYLLQANGGRSGSQPLTAATKVEIRAITSDAGRTEPGQGNH